MPDLLTTNHQPPTTLLPRPPAFTLIEMLVSLAITMIMMAAVVSLFGLIGDSVSGSRSIIEISERLRATRNRLQADLQGATATMTPPLRPENDEGYFEIIEGPLTDAAYLGPGPPPPPTPPLSHTVRGDVDDVLMFTTRSRGEPFVGRLDATTVESQVAEVMYFCAAATDTTGQRSDATVYVNPTTGNREQTYTLYRRVLLVAPGEQAHVATHLPIPSFFTEHDISAHYDGTIMVANTLGDLTKRENRFAHYANTVGTPFPYDIKLPPTPGPVENAKLGPMDGERLSDDVLLTNVLAFDVQVYDPAAPIEVRSSVALTPTDPATINPSGPLGAYVNLGWTTSVTGQLFAANAERIIRPGVSGPPTRLSPLLPTIIPGLSNPAYTYDTWSLHYENNGIAENLANHPADTATDGLDSNTNGVVDDPIVVDATGAVIGGEADTIPPFASPLRGIKVTIRVYEPSSKQVRQAVIVQDFLPE